MKTLIVIGFLTAITLFSVSLFGQTSDLTYSFTNYENSSEYSTSTSDMDIVTLESDFRELNILMLTSEEPDLNFKVIQEGKSGVFKAIANYEFFESVEFSIFNSNGVEINRGMLSDSETEINLSALPSGYYIFHVYLKNGDFQVYRINLK